MEIVAYFFDYIINIDVHLAYLFQHYGVYAYLFLFLVIFCETGLVVTPFLPGDSLIFVVGALGASDALNIKFVALILIAASIGGNIQNYYIGRFIGQKAFNMKDGRFFKKKYLIKTQAFYEKHGGKTIIISRFMPIIRTFAPFVAGVGRMKIWKFMLNNIISGVMWVTVFLLGGYYFGNIPAVKDNFTLVILAIVLISLSPSLVIYLRARFLSGKQAKGGLDDDRAIEK